ncbi:hypothetical protein WR25_14089 [Diploscapter pachys]|uniref:Uncharacterized protein n=1 Tax=Diploscapter pachys TaxID=2018661 RepID=A0A2A2KTC5_9BILA|nr:hypothetical protein WR25_14089 [Diploscapter pachys]
MKLKMILYYSAQITPAQTLFPVQPSAPPIAVIGGQPSAPPQQDEVIRSRTKFGFESQLTQCPHCHKQIQTLSELVCRKVGMVSLLSSVGRDAE